MTLWSIAQRVGSLIKPADSSEDEQKRSTALETLRIRDFRLLWLSNGFANMGVRVREMAQGWLVLEMTDSKLWVGLVNGVPGIPVLFLSLLGGAITDRVSRRNMLLRFRLLGGGLAFVMAYLITSNIIELWQVMVLAVIAGSLIAFDLPAAQTLVYDVVGRDRLLSANSLNTAAINLASIIGPSVGGVLIAGFGTDAVFYLIGGMYVAALMAVVFIQGGREPPQSQRPPIIKDLVGLVSYVRQSPITAWLIVLGIMLVFGAVFMPLVPIYARDVLGIGSVGFGTLLATQGIGALAGSLAMALMGNVRRKGLVMLAAAIIWSIGMLVFAFSRVFVISAICTFFMGVAAMSWVNSYVTVLQTSAPEEMRGRVMSIYTIAMQMIPMGWLLGGILASTLGNEAALVIGASVFIGVNLLAYASSRTLRQIA